jgi:hypothetical protein
MRTQADNEVAWAAFIFAIGSPTAVGAIPASRRLHRTQMEARQEAERWTEEMCLGSVSWEIVDDKSLVGHCGERAVVLHSMLLRPNPLGAFRLSRRVPDVVARTVDFRAHHAGARSPAMKGGGEHMPRHRIRCQQIQMAKMLQKSVTAARSNGSCRPTVSGAAAPRVTFARARGSIGSGRVTVIRWSIEFPQSGGAGQCARCVSRRSKLTGLGKKLCCAILLHLPPSLMIIVSGYHHDWQVEDPPFNRRNRLK